MDNALTQLISWNFFLFSLGIVAITYVVRTLVEYFITTVKTLDLWEKVILPIAPIILGGLIAIFATKYPYPDGLVSLSSRVIFGMVAGLLSGFTWKLIRAAISFKIKSNGGSSDDSSDGLKK